MHEQWLPISDIPVQGREFYFEDDREWAGLCFELGEDYSPLAGMTAVLTVFPQKQGVYFKGFITGLIESPCFRCLEAGQVYVDHHFDVFEDFEEYRQESLAAGILKFENGSWSVNILQVIREQLVLALPDKILCSPDCLGLCPACGENMNQDICRCETDAGDPRLQILRNLKIKTN